MFADAFAKLVAVLFVVALASSVALAGGTAPPPYTDAPVATINALGGFGRTQGWTVQAISAASRDAFADDRIPSDIKSEVEATSVTTQTRWIYLTAVCNPSNADCSMDTTQAVCVRVGPATDSPALTCPVPQAIGSTGGGYITAIGQTIGPIELRPIKSGCTSYDTCHNPVWIRGAASTSVTLHVAMAW